MTRHNQHAAADPQPADAPPQTRRTPRRPKPQRVALILAVLFALTGMASVVVADSIASHFAEGGLELGRNLGAFQQFAGADTEVRWNGIPLSLNADVLPLPVSEVIARFEDACEQSRTPLTGDSLARAEKAAQASMLEKALVYTRIDGEREAIAACFAGLGADGLRDLVARARDFSQSGDLSALGKPRYLHALRLPGQGTRALFMHANGPLPLAELLPDLAREAHGQDPVKGARPHGSRRFISIQTSRKTYGFGAYASDLLGPDAMLTDYAAQLSGVGFQPLPMPVHGPSAPQPALPRPEGARQRTFVRGDEALITQATSAADGQGLLSVVQLAIDSLPTEPTEITP